MAERKACSAMEVLAGERALWHSRDDKAKAAVLRMQHELAAAAKAASKREVELSEEVRVARAQAELKGLEAMHASALAQVCAQLSSLVQRRSH